MTENKETMIQDDDEIITLTYDDGVEQEFFELAELDFEGKWYVYLQPVEPDENFAEDEVVIYEMAEDENGEELFLPVSDETLLDKLIVELNKEGQK